ncbi:hypothetical protein FQN54_008661 [Arachnomyces sp. PD_36]|nr:hypothetical protein FQN54_008661 [Arachnomyces sp. PD_36]
MRGHPSYDPARHKITVLEASQIAGGASGKAGGLLAKWAFPSSIVPLSYKLHAELAKEHGGKERWGYREVECGQLVAEGQLPVKSAGGSEAGDGKESVSLGKRSKEAIESLKAAGVPEDLDWIVPQGLRGYEEMSESGSTAQVHPFQFTSSMASLAEEKGAKIILGLVTEIDHSADGVKSVSYQDKESGQSHTLEATDVIISAGPWTKSVFPSAPISTIRAHSVVIKPTRPVSAYTLFTNIALPDSKSKKSRPMVVSPEIYARPDGTVYICGEGDSLVPLPETTADVETDASRCQSIIDSATSISDELRGGEVTVRQACYLPNVEAPGGPMIGETGIKGMYIAAGHTCWGIQNAPGTGKLISEFVFDGQAKSARIGSLDPRKFL